MKSISMNNKILKKQNVKFNMNKYNKGFTLVELCVVVIITSCLVAIAIPLYQQHVEKADLTDASTIMVTIHLNIAQKKLSMFSGTITKEDINTIIKNNNSLSKNVKDKFVLGVVCSNADNCLSYHLYAKPKKGKNITKGLWVSSQDPTIYTCKKSATDVATLKDASKSSDCTKF